VWFLAPCGLALFLYLLRASEYGLLRTTWCGLAFGTITGGASIVWFWETLPLDFLGIQDPTVQRLAIGMTWSYVALSLGTPIAFLAPLIALSRRFFPYPVIVGALWTLGEQGRMWGFALTTWAPESLLGAHFSAASIGYVLTENFFARQLAYPFGIDGLNFLTACLAAIPVEILAYNQGGRRFGTAVAYGIAIAAISVGTLAITPAESSVPSGAPLRFAILATNRMDVRDLSTHWLLREQLVAVAQAQPPVDVIALPEEFSLTSIFWSQEEARAFIEDHFGGREILILNTRNDSYPADETNFEPEAKKLVYESTTNGELGRYIKRNLMPLGEYSPAFTRTFFSVIDDPDLHLYIDEVRELAVSSSDHRIPTVSFKGTTIGGLLCSDLLSPSLYRTLSRDENAQVLVNLANQFWFHGAKALYWKTVQMARLHAVQNRSPFVLANNAAPSFVLDRWGNFVAESKWGQSAVLYASLP
jgi:apolipoprotein N-acyltransferase